MGSRDLCNKNSKQKSINELECVLKIHTKKEVGRYVWLRSKRKLLDTGVSSYLLTIPTGLIKDKSFIQNTYSSDSRIFKTIFYYSSLQCGRHSGVVRV